ncbi:16S rRNA (guanine(966)-N(2))-methyltransferase RsmD [Gillisia mitskevichiae]|uniref:16S rRNA (Guanine(966)-N(2))-methyltransferase RsmD n=1 Tax=Gillisia mitskevichiae TaxID=270921 RepID=A0A495PSE6_9FLAO|nr:RsmD family RNA methyltransferase [Gillisia mitskevichiae]RKS52926.1 16S rRNA (guanine(966)-N(2))-methyltransferase RsmD [Gillisia mitskevichiae]
MRIISGQHKGRRITAPKKLPVRPTTDMAKEGLFNILNNNFHFNKLDVLELFAGSGNISYEFASRGAESVTSIDENIDCIKFIKKTSLELDLDITPIKSDVFKYLERAPIKADIIFADPPYNFTDDQFKKIAELVFEKGLLKEDGVLIIEHSKHSKLDNFENFDVDRRYGNSVFSFFRLV